MADSYREDMKHAIRQVVAEELKSLDVAKLVDEAVSESVRRIRAAAAAKAKAIENTDTGKLLQEAIASLFTPDRWSRSELAKGLQSAVDVAVRSAIEAKVKDAVASVSIKITPTKGA